MKIYTNKSIWRKIVIFFLIILFFQMILIHPVYADDNDDGDVIEGGGKLLRPIFSLLVTICDGVISILHSSIMNVNQTLLDIDTQSTFWEMVVKVIAVVLTVACIIGAFVLSGGIAVALGLAAALSIVTAVLPGTNSMVKFTNEVGYAVMSYFDEEQLPAKLYLPAYSYSPEEIFKGKILLFNVNFFRDPIEIKDKYKDNPDGEPTLQYHYYEDPNGDDLDIDDDGTPETKGYITSKQDSVAILQKTISSWYNALRNICLVLMLSVLVYIGIRMLLASVSADKAKYLTMLKDWFIGLCLLFLMHYIMAFSVTLVDKLSATVGASLDDNKYIAVLPKTDEITEELKAIDLELKLRADENGDIGYAWPTNLMGFLRMKSQLRSFGWTYIGEAIMFMILTILTVMFTFTYLRRLLYMAFLTLISPMVALTYCIDKLNDGQAQGFNKWLKEYIFNLLIQPMHLLLYYILITSAFETMAENVIYSIVALGFMLPAEKLLRSLFGFEKSQTASAMGPAAALTASTLLNHALNRGSKGKGNGKDKGSKDEESEYGKPPIHNEGGAIDHFINGNNDESSEENDDVRVSEDNPREIDEGGEQRDQSSEENQYSEGSGTPIPLNGSDQTDERYNSLFDDDSQVDNIDDGEEPETLDTRRESETSSTTQMPQQENPQARFQTGNGPQRQMPRSAQRN